jgi:hypothetical protein
LVAPGIDGVVELMRRHREHLAVIVDACQMRTGLAVIRRYIEAGAVVVVTGSKFFGGPPFSGAVLVPPRMGEALTSLPGGFVDYSWQGDWPVRWDERLAALPRGGSPGLYLRWEAALAEMAAFATLPAATVTAALAAFGRAVAEETAGVGPFRLLPGRPPAAVGGEAWTAMPSIFTFAVARPDGAGWLGQAALHRLYALLNDDVADLLPAGTDAGEHALARRHCHIGQPVALAAGPPGLRLAAGAREIVALGTDGEAWRHEVGRVMAKLRLLLYRLPGL